jgi:hypothetical protein
MTLNVEEAIRSIREKAALLRYLSATASHGSAAAPDSAVLGGIGEVCSDIEALSRRVKLALSTEALDLPLPKPDRASAH